MLSRWPIRAKLLLGITLLLLTVGLLCSSSFMGVYAFRGLAKSISSRASELPLTTNLAGHVSDLRVTLAQMHRLRTFQKESGLKPLESQLLREQFRATLDAYEKTLNHYKNLVENQEILDDLIRFSQTEREQLKQINQLLTTIKRITPDEDWLLHELKLNPLSVKLTKLQTLTLTLPSHLQSRMEEVSGRVKGEYRTLIGLNWIGTSAAFVLIGISSFLGYHWIFKPLKILIQGAQFISKGNFNHRILLDSEDEMAQLAGAMNQTTDNFQQITQRLDELVQQRTREVVRSEQLASVGFLAAGVAHEINNPLAAISMSAESLQIRIDSLLKTAETLEPTEGKKSTSDDQTKLIFDYLQMIQDEAFRCKEITTQLLDFSRMGDSEKQPTDLRALIQSVIDMVRHIGKYKEKPIQFSANQETIAQINAAEIKQVILNLITNALDAIDLGGEIKVELLKHAQQIEIVVTDNGCGMSETVQKHLFEPFYTRRRDGQGTGLGLSIAYQIINDHGGQILATSAGVGHGSKFRILLPVAYQAASLKAA